MYLATHIYGVPTKESKNITQSRLTRLVLTAYYAPWFSCLWDQVNRKAPQAFARALNSNKIKTKENLWVLPLRPHSSRVWHIEPLHVGERTADVRQYVAASKRLRRSVRYWRSCPKGYWQEVIAPWNLSQKGHRGCDSLERTYADMWGVGRLELCTEVLLGDSTLRGSWSWMCWQLGPVGDCRLNEAPWNFSQNGCRRWYQCIMDTGYPHQWKGSSEGTYISRGDTGSQAPKVIFNVVVVAASEDNLRWSGEMAVGSRIWWLIIGVQGHLRCSSPRRAG